LNREIATKRKAAVYSRVAVNHFSWTEDDFRWVQKLVRELSPSMGATDIWGSAAPKHDTAAVDSSPAGRTQDPRETALLEVASHPQLRRRKGYSRKKLQGDRKGSRHKNRPPH